MRVNIEEREGVVERYSVEMSQLFLWELGIACL